MAKIPQGASLDVQVAIRELNDEIISLRKELADAKKQIPTTKAVEELQQSVTRLAKTPTHLDHNDVFRKSGPPHAIGYVPDPGPTPGTSKFLREDATWQVASGGAPGPHTHASDEITHVGSGYIAADDVKEAIEELDSEKLARSGAQDMLGDLDMGGNEIGDVENLTFTGGVGAAIIDGVRTIYMDGVGEITGIKLADFSASGVGEGLIDEVRRIDMNGIGRIDDVREGVYFNADAGEGVINLPRVIHMDGDDNDGEARIDGLEAVVFNDEPAKSYIEQPSRIDWNIAVNGDYTPGEGRESWRSSLGTKVVQLVSGSEIYTAADGWAIKVAVNGDQIEAPAIDRFIVVQAKVTDAGIQKVVVEQLAVSGTAENPELTDSHRLMGVTVTSSAGAEQVVVMRRGVLFDVQEQNGEDWGSGDLLWALEDGTITNERPDAPAVQLFVGTIVDDDDGGPPFMVDVDVRLIPRITEMTGVSRIAPVDKDILVYRDDDEVWESRQIRDSRSTSVDDTISKYDAYLIRADAASGVRLIVLPPVVDAINSVVHVKKIDSTTNPVTIYGDNPAELIDDAVHQDLLLQGESLMLQCDGVSWAVI